MQHQQRIVQMSNSENKDAYARICVGVREESPQQRLENGIRELIDGLGARVSALESLGIQRSAETLAHLKGLDGDNRLLLGEINTLKRRVNELETEKGQHSNKLLVTVRVENDDGGFA